MNLGSIIVNPMRQDWGTQREILRLARFETIKVHIPPGFQTAPEHVERAINDGPVTDVILRTEDWEESWLPVWQQMVNGGFISLMRRYSQITWWVQVGNEPELYHKQPTPAQYREFLLETYDAHTAVDGLRWIAGIPISLKFYDELMRDDAVVSRYDALGCNVYGHHHVGDTGSEKYDCYQRAVATGHPIWIVETGINDAATPSAVKAQRIIEWAEALDDQHLGVTVFATGVQDRWPTYDVDTEMASVFGNRAAVAGKHRLYHPQTEWSIEPVFRDHWQRYGGVRIFGYPVSGAFMEDGRLVQYFERDRFEWHPENDPEWTVLQGRLGAEEYERRYR